MGSQFAPDDPLIVDDGRALTFIIDGLAYFCEKDGVTRIGLCADIPVAGRAACLSPYPPLRRLLAVHLVMPTPVHRAMRAEITAALGARDPARRLAMS